jgi:hypothetical protein
MNKLLKEYLAGGESAKGAGVGSCSSASESSSDS